MSSTLTHAKSTSKPMQRIEVIERLFLRLTAFYGNKFREGFAAVELDDMQQVWAEELAPYSLDEINRGVNGCRSLKWPPTLPEFLTLCRPPLDPESAFVEAIENMRRRELGEEAAWTHPAIYFAAVAVGAYEIRRYGYQAMKARWAAVLSHQLAKGSWPQIPPPTLALPAPEGRPPTAAEAEVLRAMSTLFKMPKDPDAASPV